MKIIVVGQGRVGQSIVKNLSNEGHDITIIENDSKLVEKMVNTSDVLGIYGNGASIESLREAKAEEADLVVAVTSSDEVNLLVCFLAHKLGAKDTIARVRNPEYVKQVEFMKDDLGISLSINPEYETAKAIYTNLSLPAANSVESFAKNKMQLIAYKVTKNCPLIGLSLIEISNKFKIKVLVCAVERGNDVTIPLGNFVIQENDQIHVAASHEDLVKFFQIMNETKANQIHSIMILGGSRIAFYLCKLLSSRGKYDIKVIEQNEDVCAKFAAEFAHISVINGDGTDQELLNSEGIQGMDAFVALTGVDEQNIITSMFALKVSKKKVITKINNSHFYDMMERIGAASIISPKQIIADQITSYIRAQENKSGSKINTLYKLVDGKIEAIQFDINTKSEVVGTKFRELKLKKNVLIAGIIRDGDVIIPNGNTSIQLKDSVIVITKDSLLEDITDILAK